MPPASRRPRHSASERSRYFSVTISRMGPTSCAMPPCTSTRLSCSLRRVSGATSSWVRMRWRGSRQPRLTPNSGSPSAAATPSMSFMPGHTPPESCQPPPEPPSHSPRMARAATRRRSASSSVPVRLRICPVARMPAEIRQASRLVETARREPLGISLTRLTISMPWPGVPVSRASSAGEPLLGAFHARRHDAGGDHRGLEQAQVIAREIENLGEGGDVGGGARGPRWPGAARAGRSRAGALPRAAARRRARARRGRSRR